jgi:dipeptidase D
MNNVFEGLYPEKIWTFFDEICQVPRPSKHEEKIVEWLLDFAEKHNLESRRDKIGNVIISKPATQGMEKKMGPPWGLMME